MKNPDLLKELQSVILGEYTTKIGSGSTPRGGANVYLDSGKISLIRSQNVHNDGFKSNGLVYITDDAAKKLDGVTIEENDILLNITGDSVARVCLVPKWVLPARVNQHVAIIRVQPDEFDSRYIRYYLSSPIMQDYLLGLAASGATRNALTKMMIEKLEVPKPELLEQKRIADILSSLDDKIALNREMNKTLEAMAQAIFKSWFVDFEPFKEGEFVESDLGMIPKGWEIKTLLDLSEKISKGTTPTKKDVDQAQDQRKTQFLKVKDIDGNGEIKHNDIEKISSSIHENQLKRSIVYTDDILFSIAGTIGRIAVVGEYFHNSNVNQALAFIRLIDKKFLLDLVLLNLKSTVFQDSIQSRIVQGVQANVSLSVLGNMKIIVPSRIELEKFVSIVESIRFQQNNLSNQIQTLSTLRDTLLPKLLSGEIEV